MKRLLLLLLSILIGTSGIVIIRATAADPPNLVANASLETASGSLPASWSTGKWGANTTAFNYLNTGHTGTRSVQTNVTAYTDGDAKWYFNPVTVTAGKNYTFTEWYTSTATTYVVVQYTTAAGVNSYEELPSVPAAAAWTSLSRSFTVPANITKATVFHLVRSVGSVTTDDISLSETITTPPPPPPTSGNLIANPSVETAASTTQPQGWSTGKWGTNTTTFSYLNTGHTGTRSVQTNVTTYTDGDAKWYFNPVSVSANTAYVYSHYFQSTASTDVVAQYTSNTGANTYATLGTQAASTTWKQLSYTFTTPANTAQVTIFHIVKSVGSLTVDDASLTTQASQPFTNPIQNPSLETASGTTPANWLTDAWGTNTAAFTYVTNDGHTGTKSAKTTISAYTNGDAKWYFNPVTSLIPGKQYRLTFWYKSNTTPKIAARFMVNGTEQFFGMPNPLPPANAATTWQKYSDTFTVPNNTTSMTAFVFIDSIGFVQVDDYSLDTYTPTGFTRPLVSLTFDDGHEDNVTNVLPVLSSRNLKSTQCFATQFIEGVAGGPENVNAFKNAGHEICSHTVSHPMLTSLNTTNLTYELSHSQQYLQSLVGGPVPNFASPYGDYNATVLNAIRPLYRSHRTVDEGFNSKDNFDIYRVRVQNMLSTTPLSQYQSWLDQAKATNTWLVLVYHKVGTTGIGEFDTYQNDFNQQMDALVASGMTVKTYNAALDEVVPQL